MCGRFGITTNTVRSRRYASNGYRMFPDDAITHVTQVQRMIAIGLTVDDIRGFSDCMSLIEGARSCDRLTEVQRERLKAIERQIADLEKPRARLIKMLTECGAGRGSDSRTYSDASVIRIVVGGTTPISGMVGRRHRR
ncbi:hypothetical protein BDSB_29095 [Burkholderia dolosa PC543]|nr:hypothetical protein BDSB_29095 [Burkholderia dolosa PC543]